MTAQELFKTRSTVLEYRPVSQNGAMTWYWVLLPLPGEERALAHGEGTSKGEAGVQARQQAHQLRRKITQVRVFGLVKEHALSGKYPRAALERVRRRLNLLQMEDGAQSGDQLDPKEFLHGTVDAAEAEIVQWLLAHGFKKVRKNRDRMRQYEPGALIYAGSGVYDHFRLSRLLAAQGGVDPLWAVDLLHGGIWSWSAPGQGHPDNLHAVLRQSKLKSFLEHYAVQLSAQPKPVPAEVFRALKVQVQ